MNQVLRKLGESEARLAADRYRGKSAAPRQGEPGVPPARREQIGQVVVQTAERNGLTLDREERIVVGRRDGREDSFVTFSWRLERNSAALLELANSICSRVTVVGEKIGAKTWEFEAGAARDSEGFQPFERAAFRHDAGRVSALGNDGLEIVSLPGTWRGTSPAATSPTLLTVAAARPRSLKRVVSEIVAGRWPLGFPPDRRTMAWAARTVLKPAMRGLSPELLARVEDERASMVEAVREFDRQIKDVVEELAGRRRRKGGAQQPIGTA